MLNRYKFEAKKSESRFGGGKKAMSSVLIAAIIGVIALAGIVGGGYFFFSSTNNTTTSNGGNLSSTTTTTSVATTTTAATTTSTTVSKSEITPVEVSIVSGAHLQSQSQHYVPQTITVEIGVNNTITWMNQDGAPHTVTSDTNAFNSGTIVPGSNFTMTFTSPGTYLYHCNIHPFMSGTVIVLNANGQTVPSTPSSTTSSPVTTSMTTTQTSTSSSCTYFYGGLCY